MCVCVSVSFGLALFVCSDVPLLPHLYCLKFLATEDFNPFLKTHLAFFFSLSLSRFVPVCPRFHLHDYVVISIFTTMNMNQTNWKDMMRKWIPEPTSNQRDQTKPNERRKKNTHTTTTLARPYKNNYILVVWWFSIPMALWFVSDVLKMWWPFSFLLLEARTSTKN